MSKNGNIGHICPDWVNIGSKSIFNTIFKICEELGAQRAPNEGPKGPQMPSAGARRKGQLCPELLVLLYYGRNRMKRLILFAAKMNKRKVPPL